MNREELKKTLRPLIKECIKEVIFEEGVLSGIISEVVKGTGGQRIVETQTQPTYQKQTTKLIKENYKSIDAKCLTQQVKMHTMVLTCSREPLPCQTETPEDPLHHMGLVLWTAQRLMILVLTCHLLECLRLYGQNQQRENNGYQLQNETSQKREHGTIHQTIHKKVQKIRNHSRSSRSQAFHISVREEASCS